MLRPFLGLYNRDSYSTVRFKSNFYVTVLEASAVLEV